MTNVTKKELSVIKAQKTFDEYIGSKPGAKRTSLGFRIKENDETKLYQKPVLEDEILVNGEKVCVFIIRIISSKAGAHKYYSFIHAEDVPVNKDGTFTDSNGRVFELDPKGTKVIYKPQLADFLKDDQDLFVETNENKAHAMAMGNGGVEEHA
jgi:hypothetical protein